MRTLKTTVTVHDSDGVSHHFVAGSTVPGWADGLITNTFVWDEQSTPEPETVVESGGPPPTSGPGAGRQVWADYAEANGVAVQAGWKRDSIIDALREAEVKVE